ncbi:MAG: hypothetical protein RL591_977, partial [Planctomycetota bacterium]
EDDLDWIVLKALGRPASRRYLTPDELADDLERWLRGEAISVRVSNRSYLIRKFTKRNRAVVGAGILATAALGVAAGVLIASNIQSERDAARWREVARFNERLLTAIDPAVAQGLDPTLLNLILNEAQAELGRATRDPEVEAEIRMSLGNARAATGDTEGALSQYEAVRQLQAKSGAGPQATRHVANAMGRALIEGGRLDEAARELAIAIDGNDMITAQAMHNRAALERARGELALAEQTLRDAIRRKRELNADESTIRDSEQELALVLSEAGRHQDAEPIGRLVARARMESLGARHPDTLRADNNLAEILLARGAVAEARALLSPTVAGFVEVLGPQHPDTLAARNNLAGALRELGELEEAVRLYTENRAAFLASRGRDDPRSILSCVNLAHALALVGRREEAERAFGEARMDALRVLGPSSRITLANDANFATFLVDSKRFAEAVVVAERTASLVDRELGSDHPQTLAAKATCALACLGLAQPDRALAAIGSVDALVGSDRALTRVERQFLEVAARAADASSAPSQAAQIRQRLEQGANKS